MTDAIHYLYCHQLRFYHLIFLTPPPLPPPSPFLPSCYNPANTVMIDSFITLSDVLLSLWLMTHSFNAGVHTLYTKISTNVKIHVHNRPSRLLQYIWLTANLHAKNLLSLPVLHSSFFIKVCLLDLISGTRSTWLTGNDWCDWQHGDCLCECVSTCMTDSRAAGTLCISL